LSTFALAQISDMHVGAGVQPNGLTASQSLIATLEAVARRRPNAIIATGDLVNDEKPHEYEELARILRDASAPVFLLPGNHDDRDAVRAAFPGHTYLPRSGPLSYVLNQFPLRVVMVDAIVPGEVGGCFTPAHADWLDGVLKKAPEKPTMVAVHHPPFESYDRLFDTIALAQADLFAGIIARHPQVIRIVCGHHHRTVVSAAAHAPIVCAPSTAWTYGLATLGDDQIAPITPEPAGFLLHLWRPDSRLATHLISL
jgi:3',5'-cyclic-AMP phosphodiesterase